MSFPNLSALAVRQRSVTLYFLLLSVLAGLYAFLSLGRAEDPEIKMQVQVVSVIWPGATAQQIQQQVVDPIEKKIQELDYLYRVQTTIKAGRADIQVEHQDYTPNEKQSELQFQIRKRMLDIAPQLPDGVLGPFVNDDFSDIYFSLFSLTAPGLPMRDLTREAERIRDRLRSVPGALKVNLIGERAERVHVNLDTVKLLNLGITGDQVFDAIDAYNRLLPAGQLETAGPRLQFRVQADLADTRQLEAVPIRVGNTTLRLGDIATVWQGYEDPPSYLVRSNGDDALLLGVVMEAGQNGLDFGARLQTFLAQEQAQLPLGMHIEQITNQADAISAAVDLFQMKFLVAVVVVMGVGFLALGWRAGLIVGIAIPVTLGLTFLLMKVAGVNLDRITLGALIIALGLLVDDAIIAIEMMLVKLEEGWGRVQAATHAWNATASPMLFGTLVTMFGFVPIGFAKSGVGQYAGNIFWVLAFALLVSWLVAVTFTPYLGVQMLGQPRHKHANDDTLFDTPLYRRFRRLITACLQHRLKVVAGTFAVLLLAFAGMAGPVEKQFFPGSDRPEVLISINLPRGTAVGVTDNTVRKFETLLADLPGVKNFSTYVGGGAPRFFLSVNPEYPDPAFAKIIVTAQGSRERDQIMELLTARVDAGEFAEARVRISRLLFGPPVPWPVSFRVVGPDIEQLRQIGYQVRTRMAAHPHVIQSNLQWDERMPVLQLDMDPERLRLMGMTPRDVAQQLQFQLQGVPVTEVRQNIRTVEVWARGLRDTDPEQLAVMEVRNDAGMKMSLSQLGSLQVRYEEPEIHRYNREPFVEIRGDVHGAQAPDVTQQLWQQLADVRAALPAGYRLEVAGSVEQSVKAEASISKVFPLMVALMVTCIMLQMRSFTGTLMVLATAPLGVIGAVIALLLFQQPFGFVALLGLIGLAGILMRNTLILTQQVNDNLDAGMAAADAVIEAAVRRARPVILTALAAALAFVPLATDIFWGPLAYVLIGGVLVGTAITLFFVPALYGLVYRVKPAS